MPFTPFIKKKIGLLYLIWMQKGNKYVLLEEPAWFVFSKTAKRYKATTIASQCALRYGQTYEESLEFVNDIRSAIGQINLQDNHPADVTQFPDQLKSYYFKSYLLRRYRFGGKLIDFSFESPLFESYLHPLISHLETTEFKGKVPVFELFGYDDMIVFRLDGEVKGVWTSEETHLAKGLIFMNLINVMYGKTDDFWLMTVHASAISNGRKTIILPASPGSGKTTMAALLQNQGYQLVADDFVPIDRYSCHAWPFPIAMSVKQGAVDLLSTIYSDLEQRPVNQLTPEKSVRYLTPDNILQILAPTFPVKEFIFIQYNPSIDFEWKKVDPVKAIQLLLDQSWISPLEGMAQTVLDQLSLWSFYQLTYSNNQKAMEAINHLFDHD